MFVSVRYDRAPHPDLIVQGAFSGCRILSALDESVVAAIQRPEFEGETGQIVEAFPAAAPRVLVVGLGERDELSPETFRRAAAAVGRRLAVLNLDSVHIDLPGLGADLGQAMGEALGLLAWQARLFPGSATEPTLMADLRVCALDEEFDHGLRRGLALAVSVNLARTLVETPPNVATPGWMATQARRMAAENGLEVQVVEGASLEAERLTGLITVGRASENPPCLVVLRYRPEGSGGKPAAVLLGKTVTYDTGGLSLKANNGMRGMKRDKAGGCAVLGAMHAVATVVRPDFPVVGILACAENSVSHNAYRPDDVLTFRNGVTVEVTNTDAEGRLVLADGLCWAEDRENPSFIVDLATLTGGVVTALGSTYAGCFCDDDGLRARLEAAAGQTGERLWRLPLHREYRDMMKSDVADIVNSNPNRKAHPVQGAAFLSYFVSEGTPWAHIDIAGVADTEKDSASLVPGPTGFGVRLLARLLS